MNGKILILLLTVFALGVAGGSWWTAKSSSEIAAVDTVSPGLREKLQKLTEADIEEYYRLKTAEEKYQKADEILGKIMAIFLADVGVRISQHAQNASHEKFVPIARVDDSRTIKAPLPAPTPPAKPDTSPAHEKRIRNEELQLINTRNENDIGTDLRRLKITNFADELRTSAKFSNPGGILANLNGQFGGRASLTAGGRHHDWDVLLEIQGSATQSQVNGSSKVHLTENGAEVSTFSLRGNLPGVREMAGDHNAIIVQANSITYFQLFFLRELDQLAGNVYRSDDGSQEYRYAGTVMLRRL